MKRLFSILLIVLITIDSEAQTPCDTISENIYTFLQHPPKMNLTDEDLVEKLNSNLKQDLEWNKDIEFIYVVYYVNCKGMDYKYRIAILKNGQTKIDSTSSFCLALINLLEKELQFEPGYREVKEMNKIEKVMVDFQGAITIQIKNNQF